MLSVNNLTGNVVFVRSHDIRPRQPPFSRSCPSPTPTAAPSTCSRRWRSVPTSRSLGKMPAPKILVEAMANVRPNVVVTVPLLIHEKIVRKQVFPKISRGVAKVAVKIPGVNNKIYAGIREKLIETFGGELSHVIIGGAPLNAEVEDFLTRIKFPLLRRLRHDRVRPAHQLYGFLGVHSALVRQDTRPHHGTADRFARPASMFRAKYSPAERTS